MKNSCLSVLRRATFGTILSAVLWAFPATLRADTFTVNTLTDLNPTGGGTGTGMAGDLRFCIMQANSGAHGLRNTIKFRENLTGTITLGGYELYIDGNVGNNLTITGPGASKLTIDANQASRVMFVASGNSVTISGLTLQNGNGAGTDVDKEDNDKGGAIFNDGSILTIDSCIIRNNTADFLSGGGIYSQAQDHDATLIVKDSAITDNTSTTSGRPGAGIRSFSSGGTATLTVSGCVISRNTTSSSGGGGIDSEGDSANVTISDNTVISNNSAKDGGGICSDCRAGQCIITDSVISHNAAVDDGAGIENNDGSAMTLLNCVVSDNTSMGTGGGIGNFSFNGNTPTVTVSECTIERNQAGTFGGGIYNRARSDATVNVSDSTISGNGAQQGGGIYNLADASTANLKLNNCTIAGNMAQQRGGGISNFNDGEDGRGVAAVVIANCTIGGNSVSNGTGAGIANDKATTTGPVATLTVSNTILALNPHGANYNSQDGTAVSGGFNLCDDKSAAFLTMASDKKGVLKSVLKVDKNNVPVLEDNGGVTETIALVAGSLAIDAGAAVDDPINGVPTTSDQRGFLRPIGKASDIGAYESGSKAPPAPVITSAASAIGQALEEFIFKVTATNSPSSFTATALPPGLTLDPVTGGISGTPENAGTTTVTLTVNNASDTPGKATLSLKIAPAGPIPVITNLPGATGQVGVPFSFQITATNSPTSYAATSLPPGLSVDAATGLISGTPTTAGNYQPVLFATNSSGMGNSAFTLKIDPAAPVITSKTTASGIVGQTFSYQISASNSPASYAATALPTGLHLNANTGLISGTPTAVGTTNVTISAMNASGSGSATLVISIKPAPPVITSGQYPAGQVGKAYTYRIVATNTPTSYGAAGLPAGLSVNTGTGVISGTPTTAGTFTVTISATNAGGAGMATFNVVINPAAPVIASGPDAEGQVGVTFSYQITASDTPTVYAASGLPDSLSVNPGTGVISGTPTTAGTFTITISATNAGGTGSATLILTVNPAAPAITSATTASAQVGQLFNYQIAASNTPTGYAASSLPDGLTFFAGTGVISGTPTTAGVFSLTLEASNAGGAGTATLTLTIAPLGGAATVTIVKAGDGTAFEGGAKGKVIVTRDGGDMSAALTVSFAAKGTALPGLDYKMLGGTVTIPAGAASAKIKIKPVQNDVHDGTTKVKIKLLPATDGSYVVSGSPVAKIKVIDND